MPAGRSITGKLTAITPAPQGHAMDPQHGGRFAERYPAYLFVLAFRFIRHRLTLCRIYPFYFTFSVPDY